MLRIHFYRQTTTDCNTDQTTYHPSSATRQCGSLPGQGPATVELHRLHALVHDRVPGAVWRVDRIHVGLHAGRRRVLYSVLFGHRSDRKSSSKYPLSVQKCCVTNRRMLSLPFPNQVLNLFLALLLSNFGSSSLSAPTADNETNKIAEAFNRISRFSNWIKSNIANALKFVKNKLTSQIASVQPAGEQHNHLSWIWNEGYYPLAFSKHYKLNKYLLLLLLLLPATKRNL